MADDPDDPSGGMDKKQLSERDADGLTPEIRDHDDTRSAAGRLSTSALGGLLGRAQSQHMPPGLYLVATPIGNLADITVRAADILARADQIYCEDTRMTRRLLDALGLVRPLQTYHEHNGEAQRPKIIEAIAAGRTVALVSDAGTPLIADPGFKLVRSLRAEKLAVFPIPGPSALTAALSIAGLPTDTVIFAGFLPSKQGARQTRLAEFAAASATLVLYESPNRLAATLAQAADVLGDRDAMVGRELTKKFEESRSGSLSELAAWANKSDIKGEIVVVVGPPAEPRPVEDADILAELLPLLGSGKPGAVASDVARRLGVPRTRVYELALAAKDGKC